MARPLHLRTHSTPVPGCFGCKAIGIFISAEATPYRKAAVVEKSAWWEQTVKDDEAYVSMRKQGLQPHSATGAHRLMTTAKDELEIAGLPKLWNDRQEILGSTDDTPVWAQSTEGAA